MGRSYIYRAMDSELDAAALERKRARARARTRASARSRVGARAPTRAPTSAPTSTTTGAMTGTTTDAGDARVPLGDDERHVRRNGSLRFGMAERDFSRAQACCAHRARTAGATAGSLRITAQRRAEREDWDEKLDSDGKLAHGGTRKHIARERRDEAGAKRLRAARPRGGAGSA